MNVDAEKIIDIYREKLDQSIYENSIQKALIEKLQQEIQELSEEKGEDE